MHEQTITRLNLEWSDYCMANYDNPIVVKCMAENINEYIKIKDNIYKVVLNNKNNYYIFDNRIYILSKSNKSYETFKST